MATEGFTGMDALIRGLGRLGPAVQTEGAGIVRATAQLMAATVRPQYVRRTGVLQDRVSVEEIAGAQGSLRWKVRSRAPHAHIYEEGTVERFTASTGASRGRMPAKHVFVPAAVQARSRMLQQLIALVERQQVPGMTGRLEVRQA